MMISEVDLSRPADLALDRVYVRYSFAKMYIVHTNSGTLNLTYIQTNTTPNETFHHLPKELPTTKTSKGQLMMLQGYQ